MMTSIFVSHTQEQVECAEQMRQGLEAEGYTVWREPPSLTMESMLYPSTIEQVILGSAAVALLWSSNAAQSEWVERHILFAQRLNKPIVPVLLDGTSLPNTLVAVSPIASQGSCTDVVPQLVSHLPAAQKTDALTVLCKQAAHAYIRERKVAIEQAAEMLQRGEQREAVLAILEYLAHNDLMMGVREKAQDVLNADTHKLPLQPQHAQQSRHTFGVRCKNGHVTYFDKRRVCRDEKLVRGSEERAGVELFELDLTCGQCGEAVTARVDCRGYR